MRLGRMRLPLLPIFSLLALHTLTPFAEGCSSRSTPKPRPTLSTSRPNVTFHTFPCQKEYDKYFCLNGATCFTVKVGESILYNCECPEGYMGQRCEYKDLDGDYLQKRQKVMLETASIASGAFIAVILVVIICITVYIRFQRKHKQNSDNSDEVDGWDPERRAPFSRRPPPRLPLTQLPSSDSKCQLPIGDTKKSVYVEMPASPVQPP